MGELDEEEVSNAEGWTDQKTGDHMTLWQSFVYPGIAIP